MECIIQYFGLKSYSKLKPVSSVKEEAILKAKSIRASFGGQNHISNSVTAYKHLWTKKSIRECYLKLTLVNSKNPIEKSGTRKSSRSSAGGLSK